MERNVIYYLGLCLKNHKTTAAKVRADLNVHREDPVSKKIKPVRPERHKSHIPGRAAIAVPLIAETNTRRRKKSVVMITKSGSLMIGKGTAVAQWLRRCATNRKVAGSIPADVIGIFH